MVRKYFDVAVIGAGPAGSATARRLAQHGCRVLLLERSGFEQPRVGESLAPAVQLLLTELGVWREFIALGPLPSYGTRSMWGEATPQDGSHLLSPYGKGWHVDRLVFDRMLADAAVSAGAELRCRTTLTHCEAASDGGWLLRLRQYSSRDATHRSTLLQARILIDASGRAAHLARWVGAQRILFDRLVGIAVLFDGIDISDEGFIVVETSPDGWWYSAPLPSDRMMAMLMTDGDLCGRKKLSARTCWSERLTSAPATFSRLNRNIVWGPHVFSAISQRLRRSELSTPWIAVGDAALAVDPISGSGVVRALKSSHAGVETALALLEGQTSQAIEAYEADYNLDCTTYLHERAIYYGIEQRWQTSIFWQRRAAAAAAAQVASSI